MIADRIRVAGLVVLMTISLTVRPLADESTRFDGEYFRGTGDVEYLRLLDTSRRLFDPDPEFQNMSMLYMGEWNGFVEGPTWNAWWIQNSYGTTYCALPFYPEPYRTFLRNANALWFDQMGDGQTEFEWHGNTFRPPDGNLCDAARPGLIIPKQGDGLVGLHDWALEFTAAGLLMQSEFLLIDRDAAAIERDLPRLERCADFIETRRDPKNNLFLIGVAGNLLAPSYTGWKKPDGTYDKAYLAGMSITTIAALDRLIEVEKLAGRADKAEVYTKRRDLAREGLALLTTDEGYFIRSLDPDGVRHGVFGAAQHGYFEASPNHDAICFRVADDAQSQKIYDKIASIPGLRPHDLIIANTPSYDDLYVEPNGLWGFGTWVNGGHWSTCEARMIMGHYRLGKYDDARRSMEKILTYARRFRMDNPLTQFGNEVYQPGEPVNLCYDTFGPPAAMIRGLFEYLYRADSLTILPHIPPGITELEQRFPIRFGEKRLYISTAGTGKVTGVAINGKPWTEFDASSVRLPYDKTPSEATIQIALGGAKLGPPPRPELRTKITLPKPRVLKESGAALAAASGSESRLDRLVARAGRLLAFAEKMEADGLGDSYEAAHARLAADSVAVIAQRKKMQGDGAIAPLPAASQAAADNSYLDAAARLCDGLDERIGGYGSSEDPARRRVFQLWKSTQSADPTETKAAPVMKSTDANTPPIAPSFILKCEADNDLYQALVHSGVPCRRFNAASEAVDAAPPGAALLILADRYPDLPTHIEPVIFEKARAKQMRVYVEYCSTIPGLEFGRPGKTEWERCVVSSDVFGESLAKLRILKSNDCHYLPMIPPGSAPSEPLIVVAKVAGYDKAVFGLPAATHPILFSAADPNVLVATTSLSAFRRGRYGPTEDWKLLWKWILRRLDPKANVDALDWTSAVTASYSRDEALPLSHETEAIRRAAEWTFKSRLLLHESRREAAHDDLKKMVETAPKPADDDPDGDGTLGFLEGYASPILWDGNQRQRLPLRADCMSEVAMVLALDWQLNRQERSRDTGANLLKYIYEISNIQGGVRGDPKHPAYGHIAWGTIAHGWEIANYTDDNARVILASLAASTALDNKTWMPNIFRAILANLRTTGPQGFRSDRIDIATLEQHGWQHFRDAERVNYSTHHESYMWACYLWAYDRTGYQPFLDKPRKAIGILMEGYPDKWRWQDTMERARVLLCLAWLIRVDDTPQHREWLDRILDDLLKLQVPCGAIREIPAFAGNDRVYAVQNNETYGTGETPIILQDGDPASDQLYSTGFALLGLHEAYGATKNPRIKDAEDRLAEYLCRIQIRSSEYPYLDGAWFRAFDYQRWECYASSGDVGWGAWSIESGWGQAWIAAILALRSQKTTLWDATWNAKSADLKAIFDQALKDVPQE